ncbi:MAG: hypothetical protein M5U26_20750 [Planctomycetota bacterium]|nr:hypothetical protein [Planctomycetota bacterium]
MNRSYWAMASLLLAFCFVSCVQAADEGEWTGALGCAHCNYSEATNAKGCAAAFKVGEKVYLLKVADGADEETKKKVAKFKKLAGQGDVTVKGTLSKADDGKEWVVVSEIKAAKAEGGEEGRRRRRRNVVFPLRLKK